MAENTRKPRKSESADDRADRRESNEQQRRDDADADDQRIDEMIRENIKQRGA